MVAAHFSSQLHLHSLDSFPLLPNTDLTIDLLEKHLRDGGGGGDGGGGDRGGSSGSGGGGSGGGQGGAVQRGGSGGGQRQHQQGRSETPTPQQHCDRAGQKCWKLHTQHRCFSRLDNAWHVEFGDEVECPRWAELLRSGVDIFALDYDAILAAIYALPHNPHSTPCTYSVRLADPSGGPVLAIFRSSTVLPCPAVPSGSLSSLHLPSFSTHLVSTAALQDAMVTTTTPRVQRVSICTYTRTSCHLATFTSRPESSLYTSTAEPPQVAASSQVSASGLVAALCSCRLLSHQTLLWHHRLHHPSLPRLRGMHSRLLVSGLPRSLPPLPPSPAPPCLPCVKGRQRTAPHSSFPPTTAPLHTLHMDVWGPARISGQGREHYFLLVFDDYTLYTAVFPLRTKDEVPDVLITWIRPIRLGLRERLCEDHSDKRMNEDE
ncbi:unnamed protein product [Closterium sp. NIES-53]